MNAVLVVAEVPRQLAFDVCDEATEEFARALQGRVRVVSRFLHFCQLLHVDSCWEAVGVAPLCGRLLAALLGWDTLRGLDTDGRVPLTRGQHCHLVKELINASQKIATVASFVSNVMEDLSGVQGRGINDGHGLQIR